MYHNAASAPSPEILERLQEALGSAYQIERELGGGGMSRIFLARDVALGRRVVVKLLPPEYASGVNGERFRHEILLAARLQHPHIVPILSAGEMNGVPYYTMPFIDGESLRWRLLRGDRLRVAEVLRILHDVIDALAYAHEHGVVHRDIKPDNILMSRQHAVISDFGVAKALDAAHSAGDGGFAEGESGMAIGTPAYMAPEQAAADPGTDHRADLYGFGVLAYELLTGHPPFSGREPLELLAAHVAETPIPILALQPEVPAPLAELVMRCLEKHPDRRPTSAGEVRDALEVMSSTPDIVPLPTKTPKFLERVSRIAAAVVFALFGVGGAALHVAGERADDGGMVAGAWDATSDAKPRLPAPGPGLLEAHWVGKRRAADLELPGAVAAEPPVSAPALASAAPSSSKGVVAKQASKKQASGGSERVHVEVRSKHGSASVVVASLTEARRTIETMAQRMRMLEAMAGEGEPVFATAPAIDSISVERRGDGVGATVFVNTVPAPRPEPRRQAPDGAAATAVPAAPVAPGAPVKATIIGLVDVDALLRQASAELAALTECPEQAAQRLREQVARARRGATS